MITVRPVPLSLLECLAVLRYMRKVRDDLRKDLRELQERMRAGHDGNHNAATMALDAEIAIIEEAIRKLWESYNAAVPSASPDPGDLPPGGKPP